MLEIPLQYQNTIANYINFIHSRTGPSTTTVSLAANPIVNPAARTVKATAKPASDPFKLADYFRMNTFIDDPDYFEFLMKQLLDNWSTTAPQGTTTSAAAQANPKPPTWAEQLLSTIDNDHLLREIYLHTDFRIIPNKFRQHTSFVHDWLNINAGHTITVNKQLLIHNSQLLVSESTVADFTIQTRPVDIDANIFNKYYPISQMTGNPTREELETHIVIAKFISDVGASPVHHHDLESWLICQIVVNILSL